MGDGGTKTFGFASHTTEEAANAHFIMQTSNI